VDRTDDGALSRAGRPPISVVAPFRGSAPEAAAVLDAFEAVELREGDELIVVDNTPSGVMVRAAEGRRATVVPATERWTSYYARNAGAEHATADWILFLDADVRPAPSILDDFFADSPAADCGAVSGAIVGSRAQRSLLARWSRSRHRYDTTQLMDHPAGPVAVTGNLLVRRAAFEQLGGFAEEVRSGGDFDFTHRLGAAGWSLANQPRAVVEHPVPERITELVRGSVRYGAAHAWLGRRHRGRFPRLSRPAEIAGQLARAGFWLVAGRRERAGYYALDAVTGAGEITGYLMGNAVPAPAGPSKPPDALSIVVVCDRFPEVPESFIRSEARALQRTGQAVRIEATIRAMRLARGGSRGLDVHYREDEGTARRLRDAAWLCARRPLACLRDRRERGRWASAEWVPPLRDLAPAARRLAREPDAWIHAHFADAAGLVALRLARVLGRPYSITAHGYDIYKQPTNLSEKLEGAALVTTGCDYIVRDLRRLVPGAAERVHKVVMGIDPERFRRRTPYPGGGVVLAVGRLVEKKGFADLVRAAALIGAEGPLERVLIVGDGPLREELEQLVEQLDLGKTVDLVGALDGERVRDLYEQVDLLAAPCVVAGDGDRDSMPVVAKEALAMGVPVVGTDEVGLTELIRDEWGRLVPPRSPDALARAIAELLALPMAEREAGRAFVAEHCDVSREAERLVDLIRAS
jgi:colanic acid/amylovoran biosynthesis glycosyltransferase